MSDDKNPIERVLDLLVYAPLALVLSPGEVIPELAKKGRQQIIAARMMGEYVLQHPGSIPEILGLRLPAPPPAPPPPARAPAPQVERPVERREAPEVGGPVAASNGQAPPRPTAALAIPGYDTLSASQVVQRLSGLSAEELEAVRIYEDSGRHRKTILAKVAQLQSGS